MNTNTLILYTMAKGRSIGGAVYDTAAGVGRMTGIMSLVFGILIGIGGIIGGGFYLEHEHKESQQCKHKTLVNDPFNSDGCDTNVSSVAVGVILIVISALILVGGVMYYVLTSHSKGMAAAGSVLSVLDIFRR